MRVYGIEVIQEILRRYLKENEISGQIEYSKVRDYSNELWSNKDEIFTTKLYYQLLDTNTGEMSDKIYKNAPLSDDFWRKPKYQGRKSIDDANRILSKTVAKTNKREITIPNVDFILETHRNNFTQLKLQLKPLEEQLKLFVETELKFDEKISRLDDEIRVLKEEKQKLLNSNNKLQTAIFKLFEYSKSKDVPIRNLINTGIGKTKQVEAALNEAFSNDPSAFYLYFESEEKKSKNKKISKLEDYKNSKTDKGFEDDYQFE